jgi:hypothetical protein
MGLPNWVLIGMGVYWASEIVFVHGKHMANFYDSKDLDDDGNFQLTFGFWWKFNQNRYWMASHGILSTIAFYLWINQLSDSSREKSIWFHKIAGRVSLILFVGSSFTTPIAAWNMDCNRFNQFLVSLLGIAALGYAVGAYIAIKQKNISLHRQLAFRLFACSAAFVIYGRVGVLILKHTFVPHQPATQNIAIPILAGLTLVVMEITAYNLEKGYNKNGSAATYRIFGIPNLRLNSDAVAGCAKYE